MPQGKYLAGGLQSGCTANSTGVQYKFRRKSCRIKDRTIGSWNFRKQNQALGQDGTWKSGGTDPKKFRIAA